MSGRAFIHFIKDRGSQVSKRSIAVDVNDAISTRTHRAPHRYQGTSSAGKATPSCCANTITHPDQWQGMTFNALQHAQCRNGRQRRHQGTCPCGTHLRVAQPGTGEGRGKRGTSSTKGTEPQCCSMHRTLPHSRTSSNALKHIVDHSAKTHVCRNTYLSSCSDGWRRTPSATAATPSSPRAFPPSLHHSSQRPNDEPFYRTLQLKSDFAQQSS